jgi:putative transposase
MAKQDPLRDIDDHLQRWRHLPHFESAGSIYTTRSRTHEFRTLTPAERTIVFRSIWYLEGKKYDLHAAVVMPDHFHLLIHPIETSTGSTFSLSSIFHSLKSFTAHEIAKRSGDPNVWQSERYDRIIRNEKEYYEQRRYYRDNPAEAGLVGPGETYPWFWCIGMPRPGEAASLSPED